MTHHHTLPGPAPRVTGRHKPHPLFRKTPNAKDCAVIDIGHLRYPADRPTSAGEWLFTGLDGPAAKAWNDGGIFYPWWHFRRGARVLVTETPASGRLCRELRMGGSAQCGFADWSGEWRKP